MSERRRNRCGVLLSVALAGALAMITGARGAEAAVIRLINNDGANEGFNDPTPVAPVGGNTGTSLGAQRLIAFQRAVDLWALSVDSPVEIRIGATFDPLPCDASSAILGQAGPVELFSDFTGAPLPGTYYPSALADRLAGMDLDPQENDIEAQFNSSLGTACPMQWYYGLDGAGPASQADLLTVVLHELGHGMGFLSYVCFDTSDGCAGVGARFMDLDDAFSDLLFDDRTGKVFSEMTDAERASAIVATGHLKWTGADVVAASGTLTAGADADGRVEMYAPAQLLDGSSVSHWSDVLTPNELMEPSYTGPIHDIGLTAEALADMGWNQPGTVASCPGDCNRDGQVTIGDLVTGVSIVLGDSAFSLCAAADTNRDGALEVNEIIGAVGSALNGCAGGCSFSFQDDSADQKALCLYLGRWNPVCGDDQLQIGFDGDGAGTFLAIIGTDTPVGLFGSVTSPRTAMLDGWFTDFKNLSDLQSLSGTALLSADGGTLQIAPDSAPFPINQCDFAAYQGAFTGTFQSGAAQQVDAQRLFGLRRQRLSGP